MKGSRLLPVAALALALALSGAGTAAALTLQSVGSFDQPTYVTSDPGNANVLFVVERKGTIERVVNGTAAKFADLSTEVQCEGSCQGERGLLSIALSPDFDQSGRLYVDYANDVDGVIHVEELVAAGPGHESAPAASLKPLATIPHPTENNHNGGQLQIGPDGDLYVSTGDGGGGNDQFHHAQDPLSPLGKILRLDPDAPGPATVWSLGLRNPYRFSFDSLGGGMVIADVGQKAREEIDFAPSPFPGVVGGQNANYGWNCREGLIAGPADDPQCAGAPADAFVEPVFDYPHSPDPDLGGAGRCSIIGGYVVRDAALGALGGHYVYADYCGGGLRSLQLPATANAPASEDCSLRLSAVNPVSFGEDAAHRIYVVEEGGRVSRLTGLPPANCPTPRTRPPLATPSAGSGAAPTATVPTFVGIKALRRRVERGKRALLTVFVSPCDGRRGSVVELLRDGRPNGSRYLNRACTARFAPIVRGGVSFAAATRELRTYLPGESRDLRIRLAPPQRPRR